MRNVGSALQGLPPGTELIPGPRVQRQVGRGGVGRTARHSGCCACAQARSVCAQVLLRCRADGAAAASQAGDATVASRTSAAAAAGAGPGSGREDERWVGGGVASSTPAYGLSGPADSSLLARACGGTAAGSAGGSGAGRGVPLVYAASWWAAASVDAYLADRSQPIWISLSQARLGGRGEHATACVARRL
jgi:hypothetical protein